MPVSESVRTWLRIEGLSALLLSAVFYRFLGTSWWLFFALLLVPDISMLPYLINPRAGSMTYNIVHSYFLPLSLAAAAAAFHLNAAFPYVLIWTAHIGMDRVMGYGLKYPTAFKATHLTPA